MQPTRPQTVYGGEDPYWRPAPLGPQPTFTPVGGTSPSHRKDQMRRRKFLGRTWNAILGSEDRFLIIFAVVVVAAGMVFICYVLWS